MEVATLLSMIHKVSDITTEEGVTRLIFVRAVLDLISAMLQVDTFTLQSAILFRVITTGGGPGAGRSSTYNVPQNVEQAGVSVDGT